MFDIYIGIISMQEDELLKLITKARSNIYQICDKTPLEQYPQEGGGVLLLKREDLSPVHSYKWRGAYNFIASQSAETLARGVVTASAGNHAQGVALAAAKLNIKARITMPVTVARMKANEVARIGGDFVEIVISGDTFDDARREADEAALKYNMLYVHPYDHPLVVAGQGTVGDELLMGPVWPDVVFLQIGGGGFAAGVATILKAHAPHIQIIGVEGEDQASMQAAVKAGHPVTLPTLDVFCDGTAVKHVGDYTFELCRKYIDSYMTVSNDDVCAAIQRIWELARTLPEPSGALGMAAYLKMQNELRGKNVAVVVSGANMDFARLSWIAGRASIGATLKRCYEIEICECCGSMLKLLTVVKDLELNIEDFLYGKVLSEQAFPVFGFTGTTTQLDRLEEVLKENDYIFRNVTTREDVAFRIIYANTELWKNPYMAMIEFPERPGALLTFMEDVSKLSNICYFNYSNSGEMVGRALMGFEFDDVEKRQAFIEHLRVEGPAFTEVNVEAFLKKRNYKLKCD